jgi:hypothetical protein
MVHQAVLVFHRQSLLLVAVTVVALFTLVGHMALARLRGRQDNLVVLVVEVQSRH